MRRGAGLVFVTGLHFIANQASFVKESKERFDALLISFRTLDMQSPWSASGGAFETKLCCHGLYGAHHLELS